jgi:hypothetical protein
MNHKLALSVHAMAIGLALAAMLNAGYAAETTHLVSEQSQVDGAVTSTDLDRALEQDGKQLQSIAAQNVDRLVKFDAAFPIDHGEYETFRGYMIVLFMAVTHDKQELPLRAAYLRVNGTDTKLKKVLSVFHETPRHSVAREVFGPYREFAFYLVPIEAVVGVHELLCDFAKNRTEFVVEDTPFSPPDYLSPETAIPAATLPSSGTIRTFLEREYPGFVDAMRGDRLQ